MSIISKQKEYEKQINERARKYALARKDGIFTDGYSYANRESELITLIYEYTQINRNFAIKYGSYAAAGNEYSIPLEEYGVEIFTVAKDSIKYYDPDKADFITYFNYNLDKSLSAAQGKKLFEQRHIGTSRLSAHKVRILSRIIKEMESEGETVSAEKVALEANEQGVKVKTEEIQEFISSVPSLDVPISDEKEDEGALYEIIKDENTLDPLTGHIKEENVEEFINIIESAFKKTQERQRGYLGEIMTSKICVFISENEQTALPLLEKTVWFSKEVYDRYKISGNRTEQKEIAMKYNMSESSISRAWINFTEKKLSLSNLEAIISIF